MLSDPITVTYDGDPYDLVRVSQDRQGTIYTTADREFMIEIVESRTTDGFVRREIRLTHVTPDPTPSDAFDAYSRIPNSFSLVYVTDDTKSFTSTDMPLLRTALLALVDSTLQGRLLAGEK